MEPTEVRGQLSGEGLCRELIASILVSQVGGWVQWARVLALKEQRSDMALMRGGETLVSHSARAFQLG